MATRTSRRTARTRRSHLNGTGYDSSQPFGENWADWNSASWGNGWAGTAGGVARQLGFNGRAMAEFARAVNNQKRRLAEAASGDYYGYKPEVEMPSWIAELYRSKGANTGGIVPTGQSGVGKYVDLSTINGGAGFAQPALASLAIGGEPQAPAAAAPPPATGSSPYVPSSEATAASALSPAASTRASTRASSNLLSGLAIVSGVRANSNPLAGLQLA